MGSSRTFLFMNNKRVAVIGAGLAGLVAGTTLQEAGYLVTIFDKSRGPGGRLACKRSPAGGLDFGAQYFTCRSSEFRSQVEDWNRRGVSQLWKFSPAVINQPGTTEEPNHEIDRYVGTPRMTSISRDLEKPLEKSIIYEHLITAARRQDGASGPQWILSTEKGDLQEAFDLLIINTPPQQALAFLEPGTQLYEQTKTIEMNPCWAVSVTLEESLNLPWVGAFVNCGALSWISCNSSKPQRETGQQSWVLHANAEWSKTHLEESQEFVQQELTKEFFRVAQVPPETKVAHQIAHRWRYSMAPSPLSNPGYLWDSDLQVGLIGDWCNEGKVEGAYMSGYKLSHYLTSRLSNL